MKKKRMMYEKKEDDESHPLFYIKHKYSTNGSMTLGF